MEEPLAEFRTKLDVEMDLTSNRSGRTSEISEQAESGKKTELICIYRKTWLGWRRRNRRQGPISHTKFRKFIAQLLFGNCFEKQKKLKPSRKGKRKHGNFIRTLYHNLITLTKSDFHSRLIVLL
jgi:hypothetical protein